MRLFLNGKKNRMMFYAIATPALFFGSIWGAGSFLSHPVNHFDHIGSIKTLKLFIAGAKDRHTKLAESRELFAAASEPKELWVVEEAAHVDVHQIAKEEYERRILDFFEKRLR